MASPPPPTWDVSPVIGYEHGYTDNLTVSLTYLAACAEDGQAIPKSVYVSICRASGRDKYNLGFPHVLKTPHALNHSHRARASNRKYYKQDKKLWILEYNAPQLLDCLQFLYSGEVNKELFLNEKFNLFLFFHKIVLFSSYLCKK